MGLFANGPGAYQEGMTKKIKKKGAGGVSSFLQALGRKEKSGGRIDGRGGERGQEEKIGGWEACPR